MKIRNGFVSNSSSSSFVLMGVEVNEISKELLEKIRDDQPDRLCVLDGSEGGLKESQCAVGLFLAIHSDDYSEPESISVDKALKDLKDALVKVGLPTEDIKIFSGTRCC